MWWVLDFSWSMPCVKCISLFYLNAWENKWIVTCFLCLHLWIKIGKLFILKQEHFICWLCMVLLWEFCCYSYVIKYWWATCYDEHVYLLSIFTWRCDIVLLVVFCYVFSVLSSKSLSAWSSHKCHKTNFYLVQPCGLLGDPKRFLRHIFLLSYTYGASGDLWRYLIGQVECLIESWGSIWYHEKADKNQSLSPSLSLLITSLSL